MITLHAHEYKYSLCLSPHTCTHRNWTHTHTIMMSNLAAVISHTKIFSFVHTRNKTSTWKHIPLVYIYFTNEFTKGTLIHSCARTINTVILMQTIHTHTHSHIRAHLNTLMCTHNSHTVIHMHTIHTHVRVHNCTLIVHRTSR